MSQRRSRSVKALSPNTPAVARKRALNCRRTIESFIARLRAVKSSADLHLLDGFDTFTVAGFLSFHRMGTDTLYKTHRDLLETLKHELTRVGSLMRRPAPRSVRTQSRKSEIARLKAEISELRSRLGKREQDCLILLQKLEAEMEVSKRLRQGADQTGQLSVLGPK